MNGCVVFVCVCVCVFLGLAPNAVVTWLVVLCLFVYVCVYVLGACC